MDKMAKTRRLTCSWALVFRSLVAAVRKNWSYNRTATGFLKTAVAVFLYLNWLQLQFFGMKYEKKPVANRF